MEQCEGFKVMKAVGRLRKMKEDTFAHPVKLVKEFCDYWPEGLNAEGKAWNFLDFVIAIGLKTFNWILRAYMVLGVIEQQLWKAKSQNPRIQKAHLQCIQRMRTLNWFSQGGRSESACLLICLPGAGVRQRPGGTETELEVILRALEAKDDIERTCKEKTLGGRSLQHGFDQQGGRISSKIKGIKEEKSGKNTLSERQMLRRRRRRRKESIIDEWRDMGSGKRVESKAEFDCTVPASVGGALRDPSRHSRHASWVIYMF